MNNPVLFEGEHLVFRRCRGWEYVEHRTAKESVMVVARTPEDGVVLVEEFRPAVDPAHGHFLEVRRRLGPARWLHAAQSWFHDVVPAHALGIPVAWINRKSELRCRAAETDAEVSNLTGLSDWLESGR